MNVLLGKLAITKTSLLKEDFPELDLVRKKGRFGQSALHLLSCG